MSRPIAKDYLGDGVYASDDGYHIILTTENGISTTNTIAIEDHVWNALMRYANRVWPTEKTA